MCISLKVRGYCSSFSKANFFIHSLSFALLSNKNIELIDEFKGLVCFNTIQTEHLQDKVMVKWDALCDDVGRESMQSACWLRAQLQHQKRVVSNDNYKQVDSFEDYLKKYIDSNKGSNGNMFLNEVLEPSAKVLESFRRGNLVLPTCGSSSTSSPSLSFLRATTQVTTGKENELVVLHLL